MKLNILKSLNLKHSIDNTIATIKTLGDSNICIIVPDKLSATMEKLLFEKLDIECSFNINVSTLNRLSKNILAETKAKYLTISKIGGIILLKKVLNENKDLLTSFKHAKHSYQYSNEIYKTLAQLKACQLGSEELLAYKSTDTILQQKINDLGTLLQNYNQSKTGLLDNSDTLTLTCMMLDNSNIAKNTYYIFAGFDDFTSQGYLLIERLLKVSKGVYVNTYYSDNFNKNIYYQDVFFKLITLCNKLEINYDIIPTTYSDDDLHLYLTKNLFAFNKLGISATKDTIRLYQAQNIVDELEFVARDIRKKILNGARYYQFGIGVYNLNTYSDIIKQVFNKYDLCVYLDVKKGFSNTCVYRFFANLMQLYIKNYDTLNLIELINSPFISIPNYHKSQIIQTIKFLEYRGNLSNLDCKDEQINMSAQLISELLEAFKLTNDIDIDKLISWHNALIEKLDMQGVVNQLIDNISEDYEKKILNQSLKASCQLLDEIKEFYPTASLDEILDIYSKAGAEMEIAPLPLSADCIQVIDAGEILTNFEHLYMVNCSSSTAPNILQDVGILLDKELTSVQLSHNIEPTIARMNRLNKFKLFNSSLMFDKSLCVSMSLSSPSETCSLVTELKSRIFVESTKNEQTSLSYIYPSQIKNNKVYTPLSLWDLVEYAYTNKMELDDYIVNILNKTNILNSPTEISINPNFLQTSEISSSMLETYFGCPLSYFFRYVLKLKEPESGDIQMLDIGKILHELAYLYYTNKNRDTLDISDFCNKTLNKIIQKDEKLINHINSPILVNLLNEAKQFVKHLRKLDENSQFVPTYFEKAFGEKYNLKGLPLTDKISLNGKVDRIDIFKDHFRIIDYKSGNANASLEELYYGKKLQLFLYSLAIKNATGKILSGTFYLPIKNEVGKVDKDENLYKLMGFYTNDNNLVSAYDKNLEPKSSSEYVNMSLTKDGEIKKTEKVLTPSEMDKLLNYAKQISVNAINEISNGVFKASPLRYEKNKTTCDYCPYLTLCSKSSNNIAFRKVNKVDINSFEGGEDNA